MGRDDVRLGLRYCWLGGRGECGVGVGRLGERQDARELERFLGWLVGAVCELGDLGVRWRRRRRGCGRLG